MPTSTGSPLRDASTTDAANPSRLAISPAPNDTRDPEGERVSLLYEMKVTKGSRFNAAERLRRRDRRSTTIVSFASAYVIVLTIIPIIFHVPDFIGSLITVAIVVFSIVILTFSLIQYSNGDPVKAEQHHRCAMEINALRRRLRSLPAVDFETLASYADRYDEILQRYSVNHEVVDYETYKIEHPEEFPNIKNKKELTREIKRETGIMTSIDYAMSTFMVGIISSIFAHYIYVSNLLQAFYEFLSQRLH